jgi:hypothetical protein
VSTRRVCLFAAAGLALAAVQAAAQPLQKSAVMVGAGNTQPTGQTFGYRLTYNCSSTSGPCLGAEVDDLLPAEVSFVSTVPASPAGDVAAIGVTPNYMGSGRTRVRFVMSSPLPAGNSGDLLIDVRFPNGSTPNGTVATNTADAVNLGASRVARRPKSTVRFCWLSGTLIAGAIQYQLRVQNVGTVPMQNMVIIDILPFVGDTGVRDLTPTRATTAIRPRSSCRSPLPRFPPSTRRGWRRWPPCWAWPPGARCGGGARGGREPGPAAQVHPEARGADLPG